MKQLALAALLLGLLACCSGKRNDAPIIGILTLPTDEEQCNTLMSSSTTYSGQSCFATVYVDWIESAGGRVAPVRYDSSFAELAEYVDSINAMLFTGGGLSLEPNTQYFDAALFIFERIQQRNKMGQHVPLWGTCEGFQLLNILAANDTGVLMPGFDSDNYSIPLNFTASGPRSRLFRDAGAAVEILAGKPVTANLHTFGVPPEAYEDSPRLASFFDVLSVNNDRLGRTFVSTVEAFDWPIFGTQWHPERPQFEWTVGLNLNHSPDAIAAMQYMANFLVGEARKNSQSFASPEAEAAALIYNYAPAANGESYQCYFFSQAAHHDEL